MLTNLIVLEVVVEHGLARALAIELVLAYIKIAVVTTRKGSIDIRFWPMSKLNLDRCNSKIKNLNIN